MKTLQLLAADNPLGNSDSLNLPNVATGSDTLVNVLNTTFFIMGAVAVIFIIVGGFQYVLSTGNPDRAKNAWMTMLYAFIGLIVALSALAIVKFVIARVPQ